MRCRITTTAKEWRCGCKLRWPKCEVHTLKTLINAINRSGTTSKGSKVIKKGMKNLQGDDAAYPKRRCQGQVIAARSSEQKQEPMRTMLKPGSVLANRFPRVLRLQLKEAAR